MYKNVLVTGGAGYIGSQTCKVLAQNGITPICVDNLSTGHKELVKWGPFYKVNIEDENEIKNIIKKHDIESVIHFAAKTSVAESVVSPDSYYLSNLSSTIGLLNCLKACSVKAIVFSSTCAVYGTPNQNKISESHPTNPINPYGNTKLASEFALKDYCKAFGMRTVILRYFNAAGADPELETGEWHENETHLIPLSIKAALEEKPIKVFGDKYPTKDGTCIRDYIHTLDLGYAHFQALQQMYQSPSTISEVYNLGTENGFSVLEVIEAVRRITNLDLKCIVEANRIGDPPVLVADNAKALKHLHWKPKFTEISQIVEHAFKWEKKLQSLKHP